MGHLVSIKMSLLYKSSYFFNSFFWHLLPGVSEREFVERKTPQRVLQEQTEEMLSEPEKVIYFVTENEIALGF